jgi:hypothetical protein
MAVRKDYLLRLIEEFFNFLSKIMKLKGEKQYDQALALIDETSFSVLHVDINELVSNETFFSQITEDKNFSLDQIEILAELLKVKADINQELNAVFTAINLYEKSLFLFDHVQVTSKDYSLTRANRIQEINYFLLNLKG